MRSRIKKMLVEIFEPVIELEGYKEAVFLQQAFEAIEFTKETGVSPYFRVVNEPGIPLRPVLYEDEKCIVLSSDDLSKYYFNVIPRKPISSFPKPNMEESDILLKQHLICVAKNLANKYGLADDIRIWDDGNGFSGSRFCVHCNIRVTSKNLPIDPASVNFEEYENSIPATNLETAEAIEELKNVFEEYYIMDSKYRKFLLPWSKPCVEWREPEDAEMRAVHTLFVLQNMFPYTFIGNQPFSYFEDNFPHYIPEVEQLVDNVYQTANTPMDYVDSIEGLIKDIESMFREKYHLPGYMVPE